MRTLPRMRSSDMARDRMTSTATHGLAGQLLALKTLQRIISDAGLTVDQFIDLL